LKLTAETPFSAMKTRAVPKLDGIRLGGLLIQLAAWNGSGASTHTRRFAQLAEYDYSKVVRAKGGGHGRGSKKVLPVEGTVKEPKGSEISLLLTFADFR
jgi:hypothetical protein